MPAISFPVKFILNLTIILTAIDNTPQVVKHCFHSIKAVNKNLIQNKIELNFKQIIKWNLKKKNTRIKWNARIRTQTD